MATRWLFVLVLFVGAGWAGTAYRLSGANQRLREEVRQMAARQPRPGPAAARPQEEPPSEYALPEAQQAALGGSSADVIASDDEDLDGDGQAEVAVLYTPGSAEGREPQGELAVLKQKDGQWHKVWSFEIIAPQDLQVADFNRDEVCEVFVASRPMGTGMFRDFYMFAWRSGKYVALLTAGGIGEVISYRFVDLDGDLEGERELVIEHFTEPFHKGRGHAGRYGLGFLVFGWDGKAYTPQAVRFDNHKQALVYRRPRGQ